MGKTILLVLGILGMVLSSIVFLICLMIPSMTDNRVNFEESLVGVVPSVIVFLISFLMTAIGGFLLIKTKRQTA